MIPEVAEVGHVKGCVVQVAVPRHVQAAKIVELFTQEQLDSFFILWMELRLLRQRQSIATNAHRDNKDDRVLEIYDMQVCASVSGSKNLLTPEFVQGLGLKQFHRKGLKMLSQSLSLAQANYPEDLCQSYIINAPRVFYMVWKVSFGRLLGT